MSDKKNSVASILWHAHIGGIQSRCTIIVADDVVYVGTCGTSWNTRDKRDGVHCFNIKNGKERWFTPTLSDVNEIAMAGGDLIVPTDCGDVFVLDQKSGDIRSIVRVDSAVLGKPIVYQIPGKWTAIFASISGAIYRLEQGSSNLDRLGDIDGNLRASLLPVGVDAFVACTEGGIIYKVSFSKGDLFSREIFRVPPSEYGASASISASPLSIGGRIFVGYARDTYYKSPAVACIDLQSEGLVWLAPKSEVSLGNVRSTPALVDGTLIIASAYSDSVQLLDPATGKLVGQVKLGQTVFQQWSPPVPVGPHHVALGRVDGVCSIIDVRYQRLLSSVSVATAESEHLTSLDWNQFGSDTFALYPGEPAPPGAICGAPAFDGQFLVLGTTDGSLTAVKLDLSKNAPFQRPATQQA